MADGQINVIAGAEFYEDLTEVRAENGMLKTVPVDMVRIYWGGDTKKELHAPASDRSDRYDLQPDHSKIWLKWSEAFPTEYKNYKEKRERRATGTPLIALSAFLTKARIAELERNNIFTAEQLVAIDASIIAKIGLDARALQNQTRDYLARANGVANDSKLRDELAARDAQMDAMRKQIEQLMAAQSGAPVSKPAPKPAREVPADDYTNDPAFATFNAMDDDELRARITEGEGKPPHNRCGHDTLVKMAVEMNNRLAAAA